MRVLKLQKHVSGRYFVHWDGRRRYLGRDRAKAEKLWLENLQEYQAWLQDQPPPARPTRQPKGPLVIDLIEGFLKDRLIRRGIDCHEYYAKHLRRFNHAYGPEPAESIRPVDLHKLQLTMLRPQLRGQKKKRLMALSARTINHDCAAIRTLFKWASIFHEGLELSRLATVPDLPVGPVHDETATVAEVRKAIGDAPDKLRSWLAVNYLTLARPTEVIRIVQGGGQWVRPGIFCLDRGKMDERAVIKRHLVFSPLALTWLKQTQPVWSRLDTYSAAVRRCCPWGPKTLRKSAASHLHEHHGVSRDDVELLLGHVGGRLSVTYYLPAWLRLRETVALLRL